MDAMNLKFQITLLQVYIIDKRGRTYYAKVTYYIQVLTSDLTYYWDSSAFTVW